MQGNPISDTAISLEPFQPDQRELDEVLLVTTRRHSGELLQVRGGAELFQIERVAGFVQITQPFFPPGGA